MYEERFFRIFPKTLSLINIDCFFLSNESNFKYKRKIITKFL